MRNVKKNIGFFSPSAHFLEVKCQHTGVYVQVSYACAQSKQKSAGPAEMFKPCFNTHKGMHTH